MALRSVALLPLNRPSAISTVGPKAALAEHAFSPGSRRIRPHFMILSLLEHLEQQGGSTEWRVGGLRASVSAGEPGGRHGGRWFADAQQGEPNVRSQRSEAATAAAAQDLLAASTASSSGRIMSPSTLVAERTDDGVFVAPLKSGAKERIVWVGDLELNAVEPFGGKLARPGFQLHADGMGLDLTWAIAPSRAHGAGGGEPLPRSLQMRLSLPCRPAGDVTFTNDQLDPEVWLSATRSGRMAARMRPYAALPELEVIPTEGALAFEPGPEWRLGLPVMDPDGGWRAEDRFSPGTFRWTVPAGASSVSLSIRTVPQVSTVRSERSGELGSLLARMPHGSSTGEENSGPDGNGEVSFTADEVRYWAMVLPGDLVRRETSSHVAAAELRSLLLQASAHVTGERFDVALWAARAALLVTPNHERDVTSVTLPFLRGVIGRIEEEERATGCPGGAAAGLPRWSSGIREEGDGARSVAADEIPIEYAALMHQAAVQAAGLAEAAGEGAVAHRARALSRRLRRWFQREFWLSTPDRARDLGNLHGGEGRPIRGLCLRPHMLLAASFEGAPFTTAQRRVLVRVAESRLLVPPLGLATLDHDDLEFHGDSPENGAVWPFLIGPFVEASLRAFGQDRGRQRMLMQLSSAPSLASAPMAWAHAWGKAVSPAPFLDASSDSSGAIPRHPIPLGPLKYALNIAEGARAKRLLSEGLPAAAFTSIGSSTAAAGLKS